MDIRIKNYADDRDLKELKYIFVDALDVDPTFVRYEEEYNYCKSIPGLLESHIELTPFRQDKNCWDEAYWTSLKMDLVKNFSDCRMMHMREVAQVFLAEKITRILKERGAAVTTSSTATAPIQKVEDKVEPVSTSNVPHSISRVELENREVEEAKRKLAEENRRTAALIEAEARRVEEQKRIHQSSTQITTTGGSSKKAIGIAVAVLIVTVVIILVLK